MVKNKGRRIEINKLIEVLKKEGCSVQIFQNGCQVRINNQVDIYTKSGRLFVLKGSEWIDTTKDNIRAILDAFIWEINERTKEYTPKPHNINKKPKKTGKRFTVNPNTVLSFGKYKGKRAIDVKDSKYFEWMADNCDNVQVCESLY
jgi:hypothetical protein